VYSWEFETRSRSPVLAIPDGLASVSSAVWLMTVPLDRSRFGRMPTTRLTSR
jgi:hypothetical protein